MAHNANLQLMDVMENKKKLKIPYEVYKNTLYKDNEWSLLKRPTT